MITSSHALPVQPTASGHAAGTNASSVSGSAAEVDFAALIGAGIALKPGTPELGDTPAAAKKPHAADDDKDAATVDPLALLDAIASGQVTLDPKAAAAAAAAVAAGAAPPSQAPARHGVLPTQADKSADSRVAPQTDVIAPRILREAPQAAKAATDSAKTTALPDTQKKDLPRDQQAVGR